MSDEEDTINENGKRGRGRSAFGKGSITLVRVHDFMTYCGTVIIQPGPRLNLVLGPNGTGKSSFVCALCIGLAGSTKLLGRADDLKDFVRRGMNSFWTEISLSGGPGVRGWVIRRDVRIVKKTASDGPDAKDRYESEWKINGKDRPLRDVVHLVVQELNIQFDNLCQFLPQDKVPEFANLNQFQLLSETQKAIGDSHLHNMHQQLIELRRDVKQRKLELDNLGKRVASLEGEHQKQQREFERFKQREKLLQEVELLRKLLACLVFKEQQVVCNSDKEAYEKIKADYEKMKAEEAEDVGPSRQLKELKKDAQDQLQRSMTKASNLNAASTQIQKKMGDMETDVEAEQKRLGTLQEKSTIRRRKIDEAQIKLQRAEAELAAAPLCADPEVAQRLQQLSTTKRDLQNRRAEVEAQHDNLKGQEHGLNNEMNYIDGRLRELNNVKFQKLQLLETRCRNITQLWQWVQQNANQFRKPVYGPILLEITNISQEPQQAAQYIEQHCGQKLHWFITQCREDEMLLSNQAKAMNCSTVASCLDKDLPHALSHPDGEAQQYAQFGVLNTLDGLFDAPSVVKHALTNLFGINRVYVGNNAAYGQMQSMPRVRSMFCPQGKVSITASQYNPESRSESYNDLQYGRLMTGQALEADKGERDNLTARATTIQKEVKLLHEQIDSLIREVNDVDGRQNAVDQKIRTAQNEAAAPANLRKKLSQHIIVITNSLAKEQKTEEPLNLVPACQAKIAKLMDGILAKAVELSSSLEEQWALVKEVGCADLIVKELEMQIKALETAAAERQQRVKALELQMGRAGATLDKQKEEVRKAKEAVLAASLTEEEKAHIASQAGRRSNEIQPEIDAKQEEADAVACNNANVAAEFRHRAKQIEELNASLAAETARLTKDEADIEIKKSEWLPSLKETVSAINQAFTLNFKEIGIMGEVVLEEHEDFDKFAIQIWVKFRADEPLQLLTAKRQSGGERSVSTILYLIALQGVTVTPFRVVDEINQGMDPINERKVFIQLVESSCREGTPQCFLLTPKLLPGLPFSPDITPLIIMNGQQIHADVPRTHNMGEAFFGKRFRQLQEV